MCLEVSPISPTTQASNRDSARAAIQQDIAVSIAFQDWRMAIYGYIYIYTYVTIYIYIIKYMIKYIIIYMKLYMYVIIYIYVIV